MLGIQVDNICEYEKELYVVVLRQSYVTTLLCFCRAPNGKVFVSAQVFCASKISLVRTRAVRSRVTRVWACLVSAI